MFVGHIQRLHNQLGVHLPLYRIEQIAARAGVTLARSTLADWVCRYGVALQPLADRLSALLKQRCLLHADETPVQQLDPGQGKTKRAYLWAYRSGDLDDGPRIAVFDYQTGRSGAHARAFLEGWKGHLVVDDYAGYKALFAAGVIEVGCMAHARRKFFELHKANQSPVAGEALQRISELYEIESRGRELANAERQALREREALPKLQAMQDWLQRTRDTVADGGGLARAIDYSLKRWPALSRYAQSALSQHTVGDESVKHLAGSVVRRDIPESPHPLGLGVSPSPELGSIDVDPEVDEELRIGAIREVQDVAAPHSQQFFKLAPLERAYLGHRSSPNSLLRALLELCQCSLVSIARIARPIRWHAEVRPRVFLAEQGRPFTSALKHPTAEACAFKLIMGNVDQELANLKPGMRLLCP